MVRAYLPAIVVLLSACVPGTRSVSEYEAGGPSETVVADLEARVVMPEGARPLSAYLRTYFHQGTKIVGQYRLGPPTGVRSVVEAEGAWLDGGCSIVTVSYDPVSKVVEGVACNGVA